MNQPNHQARTAANETSNNAIEKANANNGIETGTALMKIEAPTVLNFYDFYLNEHQSIICRRLHFAGSSMGLLGLATAIKTGKPAPLFKGVAAGYACAWVGHFFFDNNKPATFKYPLQSFVSDFRMYGDVLRGHLSLSDRKFDKKRQP